MYNNQSRRSGSRPGSGFGGGGRSSGGRSGYGGGGGRGYGGGNRSRGPKPKTIDPALYVKKAPNFTPYKAEEVTAMFTDIALMPVIQEAIVRRGYKHPTPIQVKSIPFILEGRDVIGIANTGTGKTGAFVLPMLQKILNNPNERVLILVPTRELGQQIRDEILQFSNGMRIYTALCIGGTNISQQIYSLNRNPHFVIGTPGRIQDLIQRNALKLDKIANIVMDEADRMVDMGFIKDITAILALMPKQRQSLFFSATVSPQIKPIIERFMVNPETVSVKINNTSDNVDQDILRVPVGRTKQDVLIEFLKQLHNGRVLIFGRTKYGVEKLSHTLNKEGLKNVSLHGDKNQNKRMHALAQFKKWDANILVATDVAARGIDVPDITHVINFDQPATYDDYIHRIGRTGRGDNKGIALTLI
jgi:superfamily II DNA/RNA helicase